jgi:endonuclease IV
MSEKNDRFIEQAAKHPLVVLLMSGYVGWLGYSVIQMHTGAAVIQANNDALTEKISRLEKVTDNTVVGFTRIDNGQAILQVQVNEIAEDVDELKEEIRRLNDTDRTSK